MLLQPPFIAIALTWTNSTVHENIFFCVPRKKFFQVFGTTQGWRNDDRIVIFGRTVSFFKFGEPSLRSPTFLWALSAFLFENNHVCFKAKIIRRCVTLSILMSCRWTSNTYVALSRIGRIVSCGAETSMHSLWNPVIVLLFTLKPGPEISPLTFLKNFSGKKATWELTDLSRQTPQSLWECISIHSTTHMWGTYEKSEVLK